MTSPADIPVFVLCGGLGTRFREQTEFRPKPMIEIGNRPILWHIMRSYAKHGFKRFVLCLGYKAEVVKEYFLHYTAMQSDFTVDLATADVTTHSIRSLRRLERHTRLHGRADDDRRSRCPRCVEVLGRL